MRQAFFQSDKESEEFFKLLLATIDHMYEKIVALHKRRGRGGQEIHTLWLMPNPHIAKSIGDIRVALVPADDPDWDINRMVEKMEAGRYSEKEWNHMPSIDGVQFNFNLLKKTGAELLDRKKPRKKDELDLQVEVQSRVVRMYRDEVETSLKPYFKDDKVKSLRLYSQKIMSIIKDHQHQHQQR